MSDRLSEILDGKRQNDNLPGGLVPEVNFNPNNGTVNVNYNDVQNVDDKVRFRREVSRKS